MYFCTLALFVDEDPEEPGQVQYLLSPSSSYSLGFYRTTLPLYYESFPELYDVNSNSKMSLPILLLTSSTANFYLNCY